MAIGEEMRNILVLAMSTLHITKGCVEKSEYMFSSTNGDNIEDLGDIVTEIGKHTKFGFGRYKLK